MAVVEGTFGWDDVGDWRSVGDLTPSAADGVKSLTVPAPVAAQASSDADAASDGGPEVIAIDSPDALVVGRPGRVVAVAGIPGAVIVDTPDALLITTRDHTQSVKDIAAKLTEN
jgi:mannose-1-phosphate guanylyltransferase